MMQVFITAEKQSIFKTKVSQERPPTPLNSIKKSPHVTMGELSGLLTVYELAFLLFRVKEAAQVEDNGQKEHEAGHGEDRHRLLTGDGTVEAFTPEPAGHVHLEPETRGDVDFIWLQLKASLTLNSSLSTGVPG